MCVCVCSLASRLLPRTREKACVVRRLCLCVVITASEARGGSQLNTLDVCVYVDHQ